MSTTFNLFSTIIYKQKVKTYNKCCKQSYKLILNNFDS